MNKVLTFRKYLILLIIEFTNYKEEYKYMLAIMYQENTIRNFYERVFKEAAVSIDQAIQEGLCLHINELNPEVIFVLYDPKIISNYIGKSSDFGLDESFESIFSCIQISSEQISSSYIKPKIAKYTMNYSGALKKGYGVLLYDIVLSYAGKGGICPDRTSVSNDAAKVWMYYDKKRSDVKSVPIDDKDKPITKPAKDDGYVHAPLDSNETIEDTVSWDKVYYITKPIKYFPLVKNSFEFLQELKQKDKKVYNMFFNSVLDEISIAEQVYKQAS